jgi:hypothetical protein
MKRSEMSPSGTQCSGVDRVVMPFDTAPTDGRTFHAWHVVWKCWLPITRRQARGFPTGCQWIDATITTVWPAEAFSHWMEMPNGPEA